MAIMLKVGTRPSPLALKQVDQIQARLPNVILQKVLIATQGDKDKITSLLARQDSDFFTKEIEQALMRGEIDAAVHSAKDLEHTMPDELMIVALTSSLSRFECLVSRDNQTLGTLPSGACVATSSRNRRDALLRHRPDLTVKDVRGNIDERLTQLDRGDFDALIVAHAALLRLGLAHRAAQIIPEEIMPAHPLQGRIAIQILRARIDLVTIFGELNEK